MAFKDLPWKTIQEKDTDLRLAGTDPESGVDVYHTGTETRLKARITFMTAKEFATFEAKPMDPVLGPITMASNSLVFATRGIGKTYFCLSMALAMANGGEFNGWRAERQYKVAYLDGEMQARTMQNRLSKLNQGQALPENLLICNPELAEGHVPNLCNEVWRKAVIDWIVAEGIEVLFLDNLATLMRGGDENTQSDWQPLQEMLTRLRSLGVATIVVHHANKAGGQRGTSGREDALDIVIRLDKPQGAVTQGAEFRMDFTKGREMKGAALTSKALRLLETEDGFLQWDIREADGNTPKPLTEQQAQAKSLLLEGKNQREAAAAVGVDEATVSKWKSKGIL